MAHAADDAYAALREAILAGSIGQGERLGEVELSLQLGVSRTPVREALRRLAADGLVDLSPNRGARVAEWSAGDLDEIYRVRALLESYGATLAADNIDMTVIPTLSSLCDEMERYARHGNARDFDRLAEVNSVFHTMVLEASGNQRLSALLSTVVEVPLVLRAFRLYSPDELDRSMSHHRDLVAALTARDGAWAGAVMRAHVLAARTALLGTSAAGQDTAASGS